MSLITEDGSGVVGADSYTTIAYASSYHTAMGNSTWANRPDLHEVAIRNATSVTDQRYGPTYRGDMVSDDQSLLYPRTQFVDGNGRTIAAQSMPTALMDAIAELALVYVNSGGELITDVSKDDAILEESVTVGKGAVSESKKYAYAVAEKTTTKSDIILKPLLNNGGNVTASRG
jgi:hypothetical protein